MASREWNDRRIEDLVGNLLRAGVLLSAGIVFAGGILYLWRHGLEPAGFNVFKGEPSDLRSISGILRDTFHLRGRGIIQLGIVVLIATPVARVALSILGFIEEGDRLYVGIAAFVLVVLLYSLLSSGFAG
jgi:uncharacterized membrane protein